MTQAVDPGMRFDEKYFTALQEAGLRGSVDMLRQRIGENPKEFRNAVLLAEDPLFVFRGNPSYEHHDALGYKNTKLDILGDLDILCLGNSQVHQLRAQPEETWPHILMERSRLNVYNGAMGGFSLVQNYLSLLELMFSKPKLILLTVYVPLNTTNCINTLEKAHPDVTRLFDCSRLKSIQRPEVRSRKLVQQLKGAHEGTRSSLVASFNERGNYNVILAMIGTSSYLVAPRHRAVNQNLDTEFGRYGLALAFKALSLHFELCRTHDIPIGLVLMPSKEYIVHRRSLKYGDVSAPYSKGLRFLGAVEGRVASEVAGFCANASIPVLDLVECLSDRMHEQIYSRDDVGSHPNVSGRELIAGEVEQWIATAFPRVFSQGNRNAGIA